MKTLNEQIERLRELVRKCYGVVAGKNGIVPEVGERNMENLPDAIASTHDTLEELTITQNGEYIPQEGVAGFSKVTANVVPTKRVVLANNTKIANSCIDENGYWAAELADVSLYTSFQQMFANCSSLQHLDVSGWDTRNAESFYLMFSDCSSLQYLDLSKLDTSNATTFQQMFNGCINIQTLNISNIDASSATSLLYTFSGCSKLSTLVGGASIEEVIANNISCLKNLKYSGDMRLINTQIDRASLRAVINGLADLTGQTAQTLTLGATLLAKLTEEDIAIGVNKNWTIV